MVSQEVVGAEEMDALKAEARELKIKGYGLIKDPDKLRAKIEEAKTMEVTTEVETPKRKKAPKMQVASVGENTRAKLIAQLEKEDPECKYIFQAAGLSQSEALAKGLEIVTKDNGEIMYHGNDIVCRTDKQSYIDWQNDRTKHSLKAMKSIDKDLSTEGGGRKIQSVSESPKNPVVGEND
jgi:hypothetical protein